MAVQGFRIDIPEAVLDDLARRLARMRQPLGIAGAAWDYGTDLSYLADLCAYWRKDYDWRGEEAGLNRFSHFRATVDGVGLHFIHEKGKGGSALPILLLHGWPDSFARFLKLIPRLTAQTLGQSFDVVVPSLPGYGFSDRPMKKGATFGFGDLMHKLMSEELGYERYAVHGGDVGAMVAEQIARSHAGAVIGLHLTEVPFVHSFNKPKRMSKAEEGYFKRMASFQQKESAYAMVQSTKPLTLAAALADSPAGLAAWIVEKLRSWSDCGGEIAKCYTQDEILTHVMIYWVTQSIDSSFFPYYDIANAAPARWMGEAIKGLVGKRHPPAAFASFPKDLVPPPREWAERFFDVVRWSDMAHGGHFAAMETPDLLAEDIRASFASGAVVRSGPMAASPA